MLPVSLKCSFVVVPSVFFNVYLYIEPLIWTLNILYASFLKHRYVLYWQNINGNSGIYVWLREQSVWKKSRKHIFIISNEVSLFLKYGTKWVIKGQCLYNIQDYKVLNNIVQLVVYEGWH
jgi:hypothetical protein